MVVEAERFERLKLKDELAALERWVQAGSEDQRQLEWQRLQDEELTEIAEAVDQLYLQSKFDYEFDGFHAVLPDGETRLIDIYERGHQTAKKIARLNGNMDFEVRRRRAEVDNQALIDAMLRGEIIGNTILEFSPYPEEAAHQYGHHYLEELGYNPRIKRAFIRVAQRSDTGGLELTTLSIDNSNFTLFRRFFEDYQAGAVSSTTDMLNRPIVLETPLSGEELASELADKYDQMLLQITGRQHYRGRNVLSGGNSMDLLASAKPHMDLYFAKLDQLGQDWQRGKLSHELASSIISSIDRYRIEKADYPLDLEQLRRLAFERELNREGAAMIKRLLEIGVWSTLVKQLDNPDKYADSHVTANEMASDFMNNALMAAGSGARMVGCGGSTSLFENTREDVISSLFSSYLRPENDYSFNRWMHCIICQPKPSKRQENKAGNKQRRKKWCGPCGICRDCDNKF